MKEKLKGSARSFRRKFLELGQHVGSFGSFCFVLFCFVWFGLVWFVCLYVCMFVCMFV